MIKKLVNIKCFKSMLIKFFSLQKRSLFSIHDPTGLLTRLWLKFCDLKEHKFHHNFKDTVVPMCDCGTETETTKHFFLRRFFFVTERQNLFSSAYDKYFSSQNLNEKSVLDILLYGFIFYIKFDLFNNFGNSKPFNIVLT